MGSFERLRQWSESDAGQRTKGRLGAIGVGLSQMGSGQAVNILPEWDRAQSEIARRKSLQAMQDPALMAGFTPEQQKMLASMPPEAAQRLIMQKMFAAPAERKIMQDVNGVNRYVDTGEQVFSGVESAAAGPEYKVVGGQLVNLSAEGGPAPVDGIGGGFRQATPEEAATNNAASGQVGPDGRFYPSATPSGMTVETGPDGSFRFVQGDGGGGTSTPKLTVDAAKNAGFLIRGRDSNTILNELETEGTDLYNNLANNVPLAGNYLVTDEYRKYDQAKRDFINATLRRESGAVISDQEFANAEVQYFPQPGDDPATISQKKANRENVVKGFEIGAGEGANHEIVTSGNKPDLSTMTADDFLNLDITQLQGADLDAAIARAEELGL